MIFFGFLNVVVGIGSALFHGSLRFGTQLLDELPMIYTVAQWWLIWLTALYRIRTRLDPRLSAHSDWLSTVPFLSFLPFVSRALSAVGLSILVRSRAAALFAYVVFWTLVHSAAGFTTVFQLHFGYMVCGGILLVLEVQRHLAPASPAASALIRRWLIAHVIFAGVAMACWLTDNFACGRLLALPAYPPLHAAWHTLCGGGTYCAMVAGALVEAATRTATILPMTGAAAAVHGSEADASAGDASAAAAAAGGAAGVKGGNDGGSVLSSHEVDDVLLFDDSDAVDVDDSHTMTSPIVSADAASSSSDGNGHGRGSSDSSSSGGRNGAKVGWVRAGPGGALISVRDVPIKVKTPVVESIPCLGGLFSLPAPYKYVVGPNKETL